MEPNTKRPDPLAFLPLRTREILALLAELDRREELQELIWILESFGNGRLKDQGEVPTHPRVTLGRPGAQSVDSERVRVRAFRSAQPRQVPEVDEAASQ